VVRRSDPLYADERNLSKVEKRTKDDMKVDRLLYARNNLEKAREPVTVAVKLRPRIRLTIRLLSGASGEPQFVEKFRDKSGP
jgi:hypothetical protein